jgi:hypothetical protein
MDPTPPNARENRFYLLFPSLGTGTSHKSTGPDPVFPGSYNNPVPHVIPNFMQAVRCSPLLNF